MAASDADACVPTVVTDFIFDLADSLTQSQRPDEQSKLYNVTFRELCSKVRVVGAPRCVLPLDTFLLNILLFPQCIVFCYFSLAFHKIHCR